MNGEIRHERRVVGHISGWQEPMNTCVCGKPWPCPDANQPSSDLLSRLRQEVANPDTSGAPYVNDDKLLAECLAEIERLTRELGTDKVLADTWKAAAADLAGQRDQLRTALDLARAYIRLAPGHWLPGEGDGQDILKRTDIAAPETRAERPVDPIFIHDAPITEAQLPAYRLACGIAQEVRRLGAHHIDMVRNAALNLLLQHNYSGTSPSIAEQREQIQTIQGVHVKNGQAVVYGDPAHYPFLSEDAPEQHNCDAMGCGSTHVLWRGPTDATETNHNQAATAPSDADDPAPVASRSLPNTLAASQTTDPDHILELFSGWMSVKFPELQKVEVGRLLDACGEFRADVLGLAAPLPAQETEAPQSNATHFECPECGSAVPHGMKCHHNL